MRGNDWVKAMSNKLKKISDAVVNIAKPVEAFVICCNDSPEYVHLGSIEKAKEKLEEIAREYYERNNLRHRFKYKEYRVRYFWHILQVNYGID